MSTLQNLPRKFFGVISAGVIGILMLIGVSGWGC
jgi:hypothetical protein